MKKTRHKGDESTVAFWLYMKALYKDEYWLVINNPEKELYDKIYADPARAKTDSNKPLGSYGHTNHGKEWVDEIRTFEDEFPSSWLDVGCGHNELIKSIRDRKSIFKVKHLRSKKSNISYKNSILKVVGIFCRFEAF